MALPSKPVYVSQGLPLLSVPTRESFVDPMDYMTKVVQQYLQKPLAQKELAEIKAHLISAFRMFDHDVSDYHLGVYAQRSTGKIHIDGEPLDDGSAAFPRMFDEGEPDVVSLGTAREHHLYFVGRSPNLGIPTIAAQYAAGDEDYVSGMVFARELFHDNISSTHPLAIAYRRYLVYAGLPTVAD